MLSPVAKLTSPKPLSQVWDYVNDSYVHRLIASKTDGKLVEVPSPAPAGSSGMAGSRPVSGGGDGSECRPGSGRGGAGSGAGEFYDAAMEEALVSSKLQSIADEYNALMVSQLDDQRKYFEVRF